MLNMEFLLKRKASLARDFVKKSVTGITTRRAKCQALHSRYTLTRCGEAHRRFHVRYNHGVKYRLDRTLVVL